MLGFLGSREWVMARRLILVVILLFLGYRTYGDAIISRLRGPNPKRDITITRAEFHPELPGAKPAWIIGFRNNSNRFTYDQIQLQATYMDAQGAVLETDKLTVKQKLPPGNEKIIGSVDFKTRGAATRGSLVVLGAEEVK
ncbi:MAG: hypothetical protein DMG13_01585 [Acidobacteria bacterium]|nr:MAG: hypothetical protein DMG13_01585 [Acidobacteriota bacterium]